ncbi:hypothetical protein [Terriglobus aquaticus]|uniref:Uncharacterized protein n=1 Tax=Terriglobus aquaticus TaxID=940139 RepID=A0ABW9KGJ0_9BACT
MSGVATFGLPLIFKTGFDRVTMIFTLALLAFTLFLFAFFVSVTHGSILPLVTICRLCLCSEARLPSHRET